MKRSAFRPGVVMLLQAALALVAPAARADPRAAEPWLEGRAAYRLLALAMDDMVLDQAGTLQGQSFWMEQRLRVGATLRRGGVTASFGADLLAGLLAGDTTDLGARFVQQPRDQINAHRGFLLRQAVITWRSALGELRVGQQVSHWGLGLISNNGDEPPPFGQQRLGDLMERVAFFTRPLPWLTSGVGADLVFRDSNAELLEGDLGINAFAALIAHSGPHMAGVYAVYRTQWDHDDERLQVAVMDLYARGRGDLPLGLSWEAALEGMLEVGRTSRMRAEPDLEGADVLAGGAVLRGALAHKPSRLRFTVELGFASGDNDLNDDTVRQAHFHPDYRVGLILFREQLGALSAHAADRLADAKHQGTAPHGVRHAVSDGRVTNALYIWPHLALGPLAGITLRAGALWAMAAADLADPYTTNNDAGGYNTNALGAPCTSRELGVELMAGLDYKLTLPLGLELGAAVQWAHLFPGAALTSASGQRPPDLDRVVARLTLGWRFSQ